MLNFCIFAISIKQLLTDFRMFWNLSTSTLKSRPIPSRTEISWLSWSTSWSSSAARWAVGAGAEDIPSLCRASWDCRSGTRQRTQRKRRRSAGNSPQPYCSGNPKCQTLSSTRSCRWSPYFAPSCVPGGLQEIRQPVLLLRCGQEWQRAQCPGGDPQVRAR